MPTEASKPLAHAWFCGLLRGGGCSRLVAMNKICAAMLLGFVGLWRVHGQVSVEIVMDREEFLPGETLTVGARVINRSGQTLHLGAEENWLSFTLDYSSGTDKIVPKLSDPPVLGEFDLESSKMATKRVNLQPHYALTRPGRYSAVAMVRIPGWDRELTSPPKVFDIVPGTDIWEKDFGLPGSASALPEVRKYLLQQAKLTKGQMQLYLRITDAAHLKTYYVQPVGPMVSFSRPEPQVDKASCLHVLYQSGPQAFTYVEFDPCGELRARQTYDYVTSRPRLGADEDGNIIVVGGLRRTTPQDFPPPPEPPEDTMQTPMPAGTNVPPPSASTNAPPAKKKEKR